MKKWLITGICLVVGLPVLWLMYTVADFGLEMHRAVKKARQIQSRLQSPEVYTPVAHKLARACQSGTTFRRDYFLDFTNLISELSGGYHGGWGKVESNAASVEMGGGFWHFGYRLNLDVEASNLISNTWVLTFYSEGYPDRNLLRFALPASETFTQQVVRGHQEELR